MEIYGVEHVFQSESVKAKILETNMEKRGVANVSQDPEVKAKILATNRELYGVDHPMQNPDIVKRGIATNMKKRGVANSFQDPEVKAKILVTNRELYGVDNPMQNPIIFSKQKQSSFARKEFVFPSGRVVFVLGYEPQCINELLKTYKESDIIAETIDIPTISYKRLETNKDNQKYERNAIYYPDILILPNLLIEVKSTWTYLKDAINNERKFKSASKQGYIIEVWIYKNKNVLAERRTYSEDTITVNFKLDSDESVLYFNEEDILSESDQTLSLDLIPSDDKLHV